MQAQECSCAPTAAGSSTSTESRISRCSCKDSAAVWPSEHWTRDRSSQPALALCRPCVLHSLSKEAVRGVLHSHSEGAERGVLHSRSKEA